MPITVYKYNNSRAENYYKQTNNKRDPYSACFPTSMINAGETVQVSFPPRHPTYERDDQYDEYLHQPEIVEWAKRRNIVATSTTDLREYWEVEEYAFNQWIGYKACAIDWKLTKEMVMETILNGGAVVTSGVFASYRHVICIVGFESVKANSTDVVGLRSIIIDDSYGNPHTKYKPVGVGGNDVVYDCDEFWNITEKDRGLHYGVIFKPKLYVNPVPKIATLSHDIEFSTVMPTSPVGIATW
jgi:hypothetical protein